MNRLFKIVLAEHPMDDEGVIPPGTDELVEVKAFRILLIRGDYVFHSEGGLELAKYPFRRVRRIEIEELRQSEAPAPMKTKLHAKKKAIAKAKNPKKAKKKR